MKQFTLLNACFFFYVFLSGAPLSELDSTRDILTFSSDKIDQVINCGKDQSCSKTSLRLPSQHKKVDYILIDFDIILVHSAYRASCPPSSRSYIFRLPIFRYLKTGLSPPPLS